MKAIVSMLVLTHNAPEYVEKTIVSVAEHTKNVEYELVVVDNASEERTRNLVIELRERGLIHKLQLLDYNSLFAKGNNIAASLASENATHFLLLNSDVEVRSPEWLSTLLASHRQGISAYGIVASPPRRVDGYCLLIDAPLYRNYQLDERFQWWWSVTQLQANVLRDGYSVLGFEKHEQYLHHFGGKSGPSFTGAKGMDVCQLEVLSWFGINKIAIENPSRGRQLKDFGKKIVTSLVPIRQ
ncbi:glycosyltransferase [Acidobacterium sp. S8]|uniref:glycosyltransferase n=1 Tax=Acidobacterium sp. S8 TaxID=1641854 RepID=UPI00131B42D8|nr:glycosyltransferase [Acidobacterium sp. S8]